MLFKELHFIIVSLEENVKIILSSPSIPSIDRQTDVIWAQLKMEHSNYWTKAEIPPHNGNTKIHNPHKFNQMKK